MERELNDFVIERERKKSEHDRYLNFEHTLRYMLCELKDEVTIKDRLAVDEIKQAVIVYVMKDKFNESNETFLSNMKTDFYNALNELEERHNDIKCQTLVIKLFMEDFYFNKQKE